MEKGKGEKGESLERARLEQAIKRYVDSGKAVAKKKSVKIVKTKHTYDITRKNTYAVYFSA